jgi:hypothetical protein
MYLALAIILKIVDSVKSEIQLSIPFRLPILNDKASEDIF